MSNFDAWLAKSEYGLEWYPAFRTITVSTQRRAAMIGGVSQAFATHLENVLTSAPILLSARNEQAINELVPNIRGTYGQVFQMQFRKHPHTDDSVSVDQLPDVQAKDLIIVSASSDDGIVAGQYSVLYAQASTRHSFGGVLICYVGLDKAFGS